MKANLRCLAILVAFYTSTHPSELVAQTNDWIDAGLSNDFADGGNWSFGFSPDPNSFENARIGSDSQVPGAPNDPTASVTTDLSAIPSSALFLGDGGGYEGTLNISSGGRLVIASGPASTTANLDVGRNGGTGFLNVSGTGQLNVGGELASPVSGNSASTITLTDSAVVTAASAFFYHNLRVVGPNVSLSTTGNLGLGQDGTHAWEFALTGGSSGPSTLSVGGTLNLGGTLTLSTLGETPSIGDSFTIADSAGVINGFGNVEVEGVAGLGLGVRARAQSVADPGSVHGVLTSVVIEQQPVLIVNRQTGDVSIRNPGSTASVAFDTYVVGSAQGSLKPANWDSLAPAAGWQQANPTATALSELNPLSSESVAAGSTFELGDVFQPADLPFGQDTDDVTFQFAPTDNGFVDGLVIYEGIPTDTLTLNVDRTTGDAQILNGFHSSVSIDTYVITSESESLAPSPGGWTAIGGDWQIALNEAGRVSELNPLDALDLASNAGQSLGSLFDFDAAGVEEDLVFQFTLPDEDFFRTGKVVFGDELTMLLPGFAADFNADGKVDGDDFLIWQTGFNTFQLPGNPATREDGDANEDSLVDGNDFLIWQAEFGSGVNGAGSATVPEPSAAALLGLACLVAVAARRGRRCSSQRLA